MNSADKKQINTMIKALDTFTQAEKGLSKEEWNALQRWLIRESSDLPAIESVNELKEALQKYLS
ncbi:MAG: hypothetical protein ACOCWY_05620 [Thermodesulfobacteriota bacterium]